MVIVGGAAATGHLEIVGDEDWFKVTLQAGSTYLFDLSGADSGGGTLGQGSITPYLRLFSPSGSFIDSSISGGTGGDPRLSFQPTASGTYFLEASTLFDNGTGTYRISASLSTLPDDYAGTAATAGVVTVGGAAATGRLEIVGDEDWFKVTLQAGSTYLFDLSGADSGGGTLGQGSITPYLRLFSPSGSFIDSSISGGTGGDPRLSFQPTASGTYFLEASTLYDDGTGTYRISASLSTVADDYPGTVATAGVVNVGGSATGRLEIVGDEDWFKVTLQAGSTYLFDLSGADSGGGTLGQDSATPYLKLYSPSGSFIESSISGGTGGDPRLSFQPTASGTYFLEASTLSDNGTGTYRISASLAAAPNAAPTASNGSANTAEDSTFNGSLPAATDANGDAITYAKASNPSHGSVTVNANGTYAYTPSANYNGSDAFTFTVADGKGGSNTYTQTLTITAVNDAPVLARDISNQSATASSPFSFTVPAGAFTDVDSATLTYTATQGNGSALPAWLSFNPSTRSFSGTPPAGDASAFVARLTASDGTSSASDTFVISTGNAIGDDWLFLATIGNAWFNQTFGRATMTALQGEVNNFAQGDPVKFAGLVYEIFFKDFKIADIAAGFANNLGLLSSTAFVTEVTSRLNAASTAYDRGLALYQITQQYAAGTLGDAALSRSFNLELDYALVFATIAGTINTPTNADGSPITLPSPSGGQRFSGTGWTGHSRGGPAAEPLPQANEGSANGRGTWNLQATGEQGPVLESELHITLVGSWEGVAVH